MSDLDANTMTDPIRDEIARVLFVRVARGRDCSEDWAAVYWDKCSNGEHRGDCALAEHQGPITCDRCVCDEFRDDADVVLKHLRDAGWSGPLGPAGEATMAPQPQLERGQTWKSALAGVGSREIVRFRQLVSGLVVVDYKIQLAGSKESFRSVALDGFRAWVRKSQARVG